MEVDYASDLFSRNTILRYFAYFKETAGAVAGSRGTRIGAIQLSNSFGEATVAVPEETFNF
jgi:hypothetical protein